MEIRLYSSGNVGVMNILCYLVTERDYVALRILNENCNTLASDKRPSLLKRLFQKNTNRTRKGIEFFCNWGGLLSSVRKTYLSMGDDT